MQFELTNSIIDDLIFAMEDQHGKEYVFDTVEKVVFDGPDVERFIEYDTIGRYLEIPDWTSMDGFKVMERFVAVLHAPLVKDALYSVLIAGKGVFRSFKNTLKEYPEVEQQWFLFKERVLREKVIEWYNVLRESWGLEVIEGEPEETENLIFDDFVFREYDTDVDTKHIKQVEQLALASLEHSFSGEIGFIAKSLWLQQIACLDTDNKLSFVCSNISEDFSGVISVSPIPKPVKNSVMVTMFFILPAWQGMGIGKELLLYFLQEMKKRNIRWVLIPEMFVPKTFTKVLLRSGFEQTAIGFTVDLHETH